MRRFKDTSLMLLMLLSIGCITSAGIVAAHNAAAQWVLLVVGYLTAAGGLHMAGVVFGSPGSTVQQVLLEMCCLLPTLCSALVVLGWGLSKPLPLGLVARLYGATITISISLSFGRRGFDILSTVSGLSLSNLQFVIHPDLSQAELNRASLSSIVGGCSVLAIFTRYQRDRNLVVITGLTLNAWSQVGVHLDDKRVGAVFGFAALASLGSFGIFSWWRYGRRLAPGLDRIKFVSFDYLREIVTKRERIRRMQELPERAFADPRKVKYLIICSHRWLDQYVCDVVSDNHPSGLRLETLVGKLEKHFSPSARHFEVSCSCKGLANWFRNLSYKFAGGNDVAIFFDFMSLPQVGQDAAGNLLPRSKEESEIFFECLPQMGSLFSQFPIMICEEVTVGTHAYIQSGWCFSEITIGALAGNVTEYAPRGVERVLGGCNDAKEQSVSSALQSVSLQHLMNAHANFDHAKVRAYLRDLDQELASKIFSSEPDRESVRNIIHDFLRKRRMVDAIRQRNAAALDTVLNELAGERRQHFLNQAMDPKLNTPLHRCVAIGFQDGVRMLIQSGANARLLNIFGDTPLQWHGFPRLGATPRLAKNLIREPEETKPRQVKAEAGSGSKGSHEGTRNEKNQQAAMPQIFEEI